MESVKFKLESSTLSYVVIFREGKISVSLFRKLGECRFDQVLKVVQKNTFLGSGDELAFRIYYMNDGVEKSFPWIQARVDSDATKKCLEHMRHVLPKSVQWLDERPEAVKDSSGRNQYDLQFLPLGYAGAGLQRGLQLWIYMIGLGILIFPLIYIAKVLITGGYRIMTSSDSIEIKKFSSKNWNWSDIEAVDLTNMNVKDQTGITSTKVMKMVVKSKTGQKSKFVMRLDHAIPLLKEMATHKLISEELVAKFS